MTSPPELLLLLLDKNIVLHLVRGNEFSRSVDGWYGLRARNDRPPISVVRVDEILSLGEKFKPRQQTGAAV